MAVTYPYSVCVLSMLHAHRWALVQDAEWSSQRVTNLKLLVPLNFATMFWTGSKSVGIQGTRNSDW